MTRPRTFLLGRIDVAPRAPRSLFLAALALAAATQMGCGPQSSTGVGNPGLTSDQQALIADGNDGSESGDLGSSTVALPLLALQRVELLADAPTAALASSKIVDPTLRLFTPHSSAGHCTATVSAASVTFDFADCDGPLGLSHLDGQLVASFSSPKAGEVAVDVSSSGLVATVGLIPRTTNVDLVAFAWVRFSGTARTSGWNGSVDVTTARGESVHHQSNYDTVYDLTSACVSLDGTSTTTWSARGISQGLVGYQRCGDRHRCPSAGTIVLERQPGSLRLELTFDGGRHAHVVTDEGAVVPIGDGTPYPLACTP
jgi:hypothetical protein